MMTIDSKPNTTDQIVPCVRAACPGVEPGTYHRASITANMCEVVVTNEAHEDDDDGDGVGDYEYHDDPDEGAPL